MKNELKTAKQTHSSTHLNPLSEILDLPLYVRGVIDKFENFLISKFSSVLEQAVKAPNVHKPFAFQVYLSEYIEQSHNQCQSSHLPAEQ